MWPISQPPEGVQWTVIDLPNVGQEANTFAEHLVRRYHTLAEYTIFSQASMSTAYKISPQNSAMFRRI